MADNKKNDPNHLGFGRLMAWKSSDIAVAGLNVIVLTYLSIYCSDTLGISPALVGTILMASKIIDAFTDVFAGWLVDNTHTKWGKGRPYEIAIVGVMLCSLGLFAGSPNWSSTFKIVWIFCMYTLVFSIFSTLRGAANAPYTIRHFDNNPILIRKVASYGGIITMAGSMSVSILFPIVMTKLATSAGGWTAAVAIFVIPLLLISLLRFLFCKENPAVDGDSNQFQPVRLNEIFTMLRRNKYVWLYAIIMLCYNTSTSLAVVSYYFKYIIGNTALIIMIGPYIMEEPESMMDKVMEQNQLPLCLTKELREYYYSIPLLTNTDALEGVVLTQMGYLFDDREGIQLRWNSYRIRERLQKSVGAYSLNSTFGQILESEKAAAVLRKCMPEVADGPMMGFIRNKTLNEMIAMAPQQREQIEAMLAMLNG